MPLLKLHRSLIQFSSAGVKYVAGLTVGGLTEVKFCGLRQIAFLSGVEFSFASKGDSTGEAVKAKMFLTV